MYIWLARILLVAIDYTSFDAVGGLRFLVLMMFRYDDQAFLADNESTACVESGRDRQQILWKLLDNSRVSENAAT